MSIYYVIIICLHVVAYIMPGLYLRLLLYIGVIHVYICVHGCLMTYGHSDIMQLLMCSFRTRSIHLLYLYMHIFMSHVLVITVHAYINRGITATSNIWLAVDATQQLRVT